MKDIIAGGLGPAFGISISVIPLIGLTVILTSKKGARGGLFYASGWFLAVFVGNTAFALCGNALGSSGTTGAVDGGLSIGSLVLAILFLGLAVQNVIKRDDVSEPAWLSTLDKSSNLRLFGLGFVLLLLNLKNLPLFAAIGASAAEAARSGGVAVTQIVVAVVVLTVVGSITALGVVAVALLAGEKGSEALGEVRGYLIEHNHAIMAVLLGYLGIAQLGKALGWA